MERRKKLRIVCVFLAVLLFALSGCSKNGQGNGPTGEPNQENPGKENPNDKSPEENRHENETPGSANPGEDTTGEDTTGEDNPGDTEAPVVMRGDYSDKVLDRSLVDGKFAVYFLGSDVVYTSYSYSQKAGDCVLLIAPDGTTMLYDCGKPISAAYYVYALQQLGIKKIDYFVNTHPHVDHCGGFALIARYFDIGQVYLPCAVDAYEHPQSQGGSTVAMMNTIKELGIPYSYLKEGDSFPFSSDINVKVYNPPEDMDFDNINPNEWSLVLKFVYKNSSVLLAGDCGNNEAKLGRASESVLAARYGSELQADVSKCNHHGDGNVNGNTMAGSKEWISTVNSKIFVAQNNQFTDEKNFFMHTSTGASVFHNGLDGTVLVYTSGDGTYEVQVEMERNNPDYFGSIGATEGHKTVQ